MSEIETVGNIQELVEAAESVVDAVKTIEDQSEPVTESTTEPETPVATTQDPDIISDGIAEFDESRAELEHKIANVSIELLETSDRAKGLKKLRDVLTDQLMELIANGPQPVRRNKPCGNATNRVASESQSEANSEPAATITTTSGVVESNEWRAASLDELQLPKGLHSKLEESDVRTIGDLVDLITEISNHRKEWPKGIGQAKITLIDDSLAEWLTKNRDKDLFGPTAQVVDQNLDQSPEPIPTMGEWEDWTDAKRSIYIDGVITRIVDSGVDLTIEETSHWKSGQEAYENGATPSECPYIPGVEMDAWMRGFIYANSVDPNNLEDDNQDEDGQDEDSQEGEDQVPDLNQVPDINIDDL